MAETEEQPLPLFDPLHLLLYPGRFANRATRALMPSFLFGTALYNQHAQQIARALHEMDAFGLYRSLRVSHFRRSWVRRVRRAAGMAFPSLDRLLRRPHAYERTWFRHVEDRSRWTSYDVSVPPALRRWLGNHWDRSRLQ